MVAMRTFGLNRLGRQSLQQGPSLERQWLVMLLSMDHPWIQLEKKINMWLHLLQQ